VINFRNCNVAADPEVLANIATWTNRATTGVDGAVRDKMYEDPSGPDYWIEGDLYRAEPNSNHLTLIWGRYIITVDGKRIPNPDPQPY
jgi:hypothetical protein